MSNDGRETHLICLYCCGENIAGDREHFIQKKGKLNKDGNPVRASWSSGWFHKMKGSKFPRLATELHDHDANMVQRALQAYQDKLQRKGMAGPSEDMPSLETVVEKYKTDSLARKGADWVSQLGGGINLLYGDKECDEIMVRKHQSSTALLSMVKPGVYPLSSNNHLRLATQATVLDYGKTAEGDKFAPWFCGCCIQRWSWGREGGHRLMVACTGDEVEGDEVFSAYIGNNLDREAIKKGDKTTCLLENQISLLRTAQLLAKIGAVELEVNSREGRKRHKEAILKAIHLLNEENERVLGKMSQVVTIQTAPWKDTKHGQRKIYCENPTLSIDNPGKPFRALAIPYGSVPTLTSMDLQMWLDLAASFLNLETVQVNGAGQKEALAKLRSGVARLNIDAKL